VHFLRCQTDVNKQKQRPECGEPGLCPAGPAWRERRPRVQHAALEGGPEEAALHQRGQGPYHHLRGGRHSKLVHHPCLLPEAVWDFDAGQWPGLQCAVELRSFGKVVQIPVGFWVQADVVYVRVFYGVLRVYGILWILVGLLGQAEVVVVWFFMASCGFSGAQADAVAGRLVVFTRSL
jgi:hypothetical protein